MGRRVRRALYQPDNAMVSGGLLTITAQRRQVANPNYVAGSSDWKTNRQFAQYTSSSLTSSGKRSYQYGRFEMCGQIDLAIGANGGDPTNTTFPMVYAVDYVRVYQQ
ncbi:MAG TPA: hypothetical protein VGM06_18115 [Polyangiaceae bacterium]|jgi:beta-glucanase (GH16 family)